jgi:hypothetical protein
MSSLSHYKERLVCERSENGTLKCQVEPERKLVLPPLPRLPFHPIEQFPTVSSQPLETIETVEISREGLQKLNRDIRYVLPKYPPLSYEAELLNTVSRLILGVATGGITEIVNPENLYEVKNILTSEGFGRNVGPLTALASLMAK